MSKRELFKEEIKAIREAAREVKQEEAAVREAEGVLCRQEKRFKAAMSAMDKKFYEAGGGILDVFGELLNFSNLRDEEPLVTVRKKKIGAPCKFVVIKIAVKDLTQFWPVGYSVFRAKNINPIDWLCRLQKRRFLSRTNTLVKFRGGFFEWNGKEWKRFKASWKEGAEK